MNKSLMWLIIVLVVLGAGYYGYKSMNGQGGYTPPVPSQVMPATSSGPSSATSQGTGNSVFMTKSGSVGNYMTDPNKGMTLYTFTKDSAGVSTCNGSCATLWPPYGATTSTGLPSGVTVITRSDGTMQYAWNGMPLYFYAKDVNPGDTNGQGVGGVWYVAK